MKEYLVICYAVHNKKIERYSVFDNKYDAYTFLEKDVHNTYEDEMNSTEEDKYSIDFRISDDGSAHLSSYNKKYYEWSWEVIEV